jgi:hypothetical protein
LEIVHRFRETVDGSGIAANRHATYTGSDQGMQSSGNLLLSTAMHSVRRDGGGRRGSHIHPDGQSKGIGVRRP